MIERLETDAAAFKNDRLWRNHRCTVRYYRRCICATSRIASLGNLKHTRRRLSRRRDVDRRWNHAPTKSAAIGLQQPLPCFRKVDGMNDAAALRAHDADASRTRGPYRRQHAIWQIGLQIDGNHIGQHDVSERNVTAVRGRCEANTFHRSVFVSELNRSFSDWRQRQHETPLLVGRRIEGEMG